MLGEPTNPFSLTRAAQSTRGAQKQFPISLTDIKMIVKREEEIHPERNPVVRWFKKLMTVTPEYRGDKFFVRENDPFIVYTSNVFAILGLRSLYFALAGVMDKFHYLKIGLGVVLSFVGVKMILAHTAWKIDTLVSFSASSSSKRCSRWPHMVASRGATSPTAGTCLIS
jgi:predicted tellurium resistance membrane protein TerC